MVPIGDWYDTIALPAGRIGLVVGDVEGHNIESSIIMGQLRSALIAYAAEGHDCTRGVMPQCAAVAA